MTIPALSSVATPAFVARCNQPMKSSSTSFGQAVRFGADPGTLGIGVLVVLGLLSLIGGFAIGGDMHRASEDARKIRERNNRCW